MIFSPMLAGTVKSIDDIKYPVLASVKLDGIRALMIKGKCVSRNFKPIPNNKIRTAIEKIFPDNVDGEIIISMPNGKAQSFSKITSIVMTEDEQEHNFEYHVFDYVKDKLNKPYQDRMKDLAELHFKIDSDHFMPLFPQTINNREELLEFETRCIKAKYEGVIIRSPDGPYKCGRSTLKEGYLLKIKRFKDSDAIILALEEKMHNANIKQKDVFGHSKRSSHQDNLVPANTLGTIVVRDIHTNQEFRIGSGFNDDLRKEIWSNKNKYVGKLVKYRFQSAGVKLLPRFPSFIGFRDKNDL